MARWKRGFIGAAVGALPGVLVVVIVTLVELVWSPQEILLEVAVLGS